VVRRHLRGTAGAADGARVKELVAQHGAAKDRAQELLERWERTQLELERAEASVEA
jgi:hypothetical protein